MQHLNYQQILWHDIEVIMEEKVHNNVMSKTIQFSKGMQDKQQSLEYYKRQRNATSPIHDVQTGKYGEYVAAYYLRRQWGFPAVCPDIEIKNSNEKNWDCDLPFNIKDAAYPNCHVKTCDQKSSDFVSRNCNSKYSWTFQYANKTGIGGRDQLFNNPNSKELILFMFVPDLNNKSRVIASAPWNEVCKLLKDPIATKFIGLKKCIYSEDLMQLSNQHLMVYNENS